MITNKYSIINGEDTLNLQRRRNYRNTEKYEYNCGGYALENYAWYLPYSEDQRWDMSIYESSEDSDDLAIKMVSHMLKDYKGRMRKINDVKELRQGEYAIAFRASKWHGDFHYAKLGKTGCGITRWVVANAFVSCLKRRCSALLGAVVYMIVGCTC